MCAHLSHLYGEEDHDDSLEWREGDGSQRLVCLTAGRGGLDSTVLSEGERSTATSMPRCRQETSEQLRYDGVA